MVRGWFDGGVTPGEGDIPVSMNVDYIRVYQVKGSTNGSYTDNSTEITPALEDKTFGKTVQSSGTENEVFSASNLVDNNTVIINEIDGCL